MRRRTGILLGCGGTLAALAAVLLFLHAPVLRGVAGFLSVEDELAASDAIYVLNGDLDTRPFHAAELFHRGLAPLVVVPRPPAGAAERAGVLPNEAELAVEVLGRSGVPDSAILRLPTLATSTWEEAAALGSVAREMGLGSVIVVTSESHTRRARWAVRRHLPEGVRLLMAGAPSDRYDLDAWWRTEDGLVAVVNEWIKLLYYPLRY